MTSTGYVVDRELFLQEYGEALAQGYAAVFAGAGLSRASGLVDWKGLLRDFATELGLDINIETDLVTVAQYHLNAQGDDRTRLHEKLVSEFGTPVPPSPAHTALASLPIHTIWTSNYDDLIERSLRDAGRQTVVKNSGKSLSVVSARADALVLKLHGDLSDPQSLIITRDDYARYMQLHPGFRDRLKVDLTERTFLFIGFSFSDPHLAFILEQLKQERRDNPRRHFAIIRRERATTRSRKTTRYSATRQQLQIRDLARYGIQTLLIDDHDEVPVILQRLRSRYLRKYVFVSGAATDFTPRDEAWIEALGFKLGAALITHGFNLVSGLGLGVSRSAISGALNELYKTIDPQVQDRLNLWPFPIKRKAAWDRRYRESMLARAGFAVFICGNRRAKNGNPEMSPGVLEEFELACAAGVYPLPIGSTGWAAAELWKQVDANFATIFPRGTPKRPFRILNSPAASAEDVIQALFVLMRHLQPN